VKVDHPRAAALAPAFQSPPQLPHAARSGDQVACRRDNLPEVPVSSSLISLRATDRNSGVSTTLIGTVRAMMDTTPMSQLRQSKK
jgi:hypothetical protein